MEELSKKYKSAKKALKAFEEVLKEPETQINRDAAIQRFEFTFEISWKTLQSFLKQGEGIIANSPKSVFREALTLKLLTEKETELAMAMTDDRNMTVHTYHEGLARTIYNKLPVYYKLFESLLGIISKKAKI